jgi:tetrahydromethanopterin S-methyltransferase subunit G
VKLRRRKSEPDASRKYDPDEVDELTRRANDLLDELHEVMSEMSQRMQAAAEEEDSSR